MSRDAGEIVDDLGNLLTRIDREQSPVSKIQMDMFSNLFRPRMRMVYEFGSYVVSFVYLTDGVEMLGNLELDFVPHFRLFLKKRF